MNYEQAIAFVRRNGNDVERARLEVLLTGKPPSREIIARLFADQHPDGGVGAILG